MIDPHPPDLRPQSGQKVLSLDELQDIDELCVVEGTELAAGAGTPTKSDAVLRIGSVSTSAQAGDKLVSD